MLEASLDMRRVGLDVLNNARRQSAGRVYRAPGVGVVLWLRQPRSTLNVRVPYAFYHLMAALSAFQSTLSSSLRCVA